MPTWVIRQAQRIKNHLAVARFTSHYKVAIVLPNGLCAEKPGPRFRHAGRAIWKCIVTWLMPSERGILQDPSPVTRAATHAYFRAGELMPTALSTIGIPGARLSIEHRTGRRCHAPRTAGGQVTGSDFGSQATRRVPA